MKQVIVVNASLKLPKGKLAAQVAHAAVAAFPEAGARAKQPWLKEGMPKVVLRGETSEDLLRLQSMADQHHIPASLIRDAGKTVVPTEERSRLGLGPADDELSDALTEELKLLS